MDQDGLLTLYTYNIYANKLMFDTVGQLTEAEFNQQCSPSHGSVHRLLGHMLGCESFFLAQCQGKPDEFDYTALPTLALLRGYWTKLEEQQLDFIHSQNQADLARQVQVELRGESLVFPAWQLLLQAMVHSIHHRGELSIVLTELGHPLPTLDILLYFIHQSGQDWPD